MPDEKPQKISIGFEGGQVLAARVKPDALRQLRSALGQSDGWHELSAEDGTVAPRTFGRFAGDLIASDENSGKIYAIAPDGQTSLVARSGLAHGGDTGVESEAFLPPHGRFEALLADRGTPGNRHPGDDVLLHVSSAALFAAGARPGDFLIATEGGAKTDAVRCGATRCVVRHVADGPRIAHPEGHIAIVR